MLIPIHSSALGPIGLGVEPKRNFETGEQRHLDGTPQWTVQTFLQAVGEVVKVTVTAEAAPQIAPGTPLEFSGFKTGVYATDKGRAGFYFVADEVVA